MKNLLTLVCLLVVALANAREIPQPISIDDLRIVGDLANGRATFTLEGTANVHDSRGGSLAVLRGPVALTEFPSNGKWRVEAKDGQYLIRFEHGGTFRIEIKFAANVQQSNGWNQVEFGVAPSVLKPIRLKGVPADTQLQLAGSAPPQYKEGEFRGFLAGEGDVAVRWKEAPKPTEGKLFYSAEMLSQLSISPGLLRQVALLDFKVMQGELNQVVVGLRGPGEVTRVQGDQLLAWKIEPTDNPNERRLTVQLNQAQKEQFALQIQTQTALGAFPQTVDVLQLHPESATRFAGYFRIANEGAVRLEVTQAKGLSQLSAEQFPETELTRAALRTDGSQRFVYRFSSADFGLQIAADQILPELSVSEVLSYRLGQNELTVDGEFELDIREAPLRELSVRLPGGYAIAQVNAAGLSDYFQSEAAQEQSELRLVFAQPISGRQIVQLRLERNKALSEASWTIPRLEILKAKSVRGHIASVAEPGFRLTPERTSGLTEIATALFPRKLPGIQSAFRINDAAWQAVLRVERLSQSIQADVLHLFSIGEGIAYGSTVLNYVISGAPVSAFKVGLSDEYFNVEFTGKDVRNWQKVAGGYEVQLHTPVAGPYTLLATYERPFKPQGETLAFTGAHPLDVQSEQGHTVIVSAYQFQVKAVEVSPGLLPLEPGELPAEYRLLFDAPVLAAYRYLARPFNLRLALSPLAQGDSLSLVADRAVLTTRISKEGQVLTDVRYFLKNRGNPHLRLRLTKGTRLWSVSVNGAPVVPVSDQDSNLIPLPQAKDPNSVLTVDFKLASISRDPKRLGVVAPIIDAPLMLAEWRLAPDVGQRLVYRRGSLRPIGGTGDNSGFAQMSRALAPPLVARSLGLLGTALACLVLGLVGLRWALGASFRFSPRHSAGLALNLLAVITSLVALNGFANHLAAANTNTGGDLNFVAPVQQANGAMNIEVLNLDDKPSLGRQLISAWPALLAFPAWALAAVLAGRTRKSLALVLGWVMASWGALAMANGAVWFLGVAGAFVLLHVIAPLVISWWRVPAHKQNVGLTAPSAGSASAGAILLLALLLWGGSRPAWAAAPESSRVEQVGRPELVWHQLKISDRFGYGVAKIHWEANKGQILPLPFEPAVLTGIRFPTDALRLERVPVAAISGRMAAATNSAWTQQLVAKRRGSFDLEVDYEVAVEECADRSGLFVPLGSGTINRLNLTVVNRDVEISSPQAVSVHCELSSSNTVAEVLLSPAPRIRLEWKPRSRDLQHEKPVFYAELSQLYAPAAGVIEAAHLVSLRLAQGEVSELLFDVPPGITVTDVLEPSQGPSAQSGPRPGAGALVSLWRFDPDTRKLRVSFSSPQARPFSVLVRSQIASGPLPLEQSLGSISVEGAADQIGLVGVATGSDVQLDSAVSSSLSPINLEDFPVDLVDKLRPGIPGLTLRRAFRYGHAGAELSLRASAVEPDVRVESQETVSLGEDRTVLAVNTVAAITRAGIFRLSFVLPPGFDVESISGPALSHWTQTRQETNQVINLHLTARTQGQQTFAISLVGPGAKATNGWVAPQLVFQEATRQSGTVLLVPEQGLRLQVAGADGLAQLDPQKSGIKQKGVLGFRILQKARRLVLDLEQVTAWIQVNSLQHASVGDAQVKIIANLQYQIENTGLKSFHILIPTNAETVRFEGEGITDFLPLPAGITNGLQRWEVRLQRRMLGPFLLQLSYQQAVPQNATQWALRGVEAAEVNLQRGFVTVESSGRLQVQVENLPPTLQSAEWQSIPRVLQQGLQGGAANFSYRLVEPDFELPLKLERFPATQLLPGRITSVSFTSVIADDGVMLTQAKLEMLPGSKRLLRFTLPANARFWFAFVNQNGVWPWREQDRILIPVDQPSGASQPVPVELFYTCKVGPANPRAAELDLLAPQFDLPLENITWRVSFADKWELRKWSGSLQLQQQEVLPLNAGLDLQSYLQSESLQQEQRTKVAESFLAAANSALAQGDPQQARRSFQAAYGLSTHDAAFNEDARVQLHNIKLQEALVGLNVRQAGASGDAGALGGKLRELRDRKVPHYTQQDAKDILERNSSDENAAFMKLAERLIQQQDAAATAPTALHASIPEQGRVLIFKRAVLIDPWAELGLHLRVGATAAATWLIGVSLLSAIFALLILLLWLAKDRLLPARP